jgi:hypothetical protein
MNVRTITYVEYQHPGSFYSEDESRAVDGRDPQRAAADAPDSAFAFAFYEVITAAVTVDREKVELRSRARRRSATYYIDGEVLDEHGVASLPGDHQILLSNMRGNGWSFVVKCRTGNFQPFDPPGDQVITRVASADR